MLISRKRGLKLRTNVPCERSSFCDKTSQPLPRVILRINVDLTNPTNTLATSLLSMRNQFSQRLECWNAGNGYLHVRSRRGTHDFELRPKVLLVHRLPKVVPRPAIFVMELPNTMERAKLSCPILAKLL